MASRVAGSRKASHIGGTSVSRLSRAQAPPRRATPAAWESNQGPPIIVEVIDGVEHDVTPAAPLPRAIAAAQMAKLQVRRAARRRDSRRRYLPYTVPPWTTMCPRAKTSA